MLHTKFECKECGKLTCYCNEQLNDACERLNDPPLQGVCKDCGNGTLNNSIVRAFNCEEDGYICCARCGSEHLDIL